MRVSPLIEGLLQKKDCWSISHQYLQHFRNSNGFVSVRVPIPVSTPISTTSGAKQTQQLSEAIVSPTRLNKESFQHTTSNTTNRLQQDASVLSVSTANSASSLTTQETLSSPIINNNEHLVTLLVDRNITPPIRVISRNNTPFTVDYIKEALMSAYRYRKEYPGFDTSETAAYRLVHETGDGLPGLAIDIYAQYAQMNVYSTHWYTHTRMIADFLRNTLHYKGVYVKHRIRGKPQLSKHIGGEKAVIGEEEHKTVVVENSMKFLVDLADSHSNGLFLDMRSNRKFVYDLLRKHYDKSKGVRVLNTFSHTCSYSVYAAMANAYTTSIDMAQDYLDIGKQNFVLNSIKPNLPRHQFIADDVINFASGDGSKEKYDVIILDPPSYLLSKLGPQKSDHRSNKMATKDVNSDDNRMSNYHNLVEKLAPLVRENGFLIAFANTRQITQENWEKSVLLGLEKIGPNSPNNTENMKFKKLGPLGQDIDFRTKEGDIFGQYLKGIVLQKEKK